MPLYKRHQIAPSLLPPSEVHSEKTLVYASGSRSSPDTESAAALILDFPASRTEK